MAVCPKDPEREHRITYEVVVDAYGPAEMATGWYYYLDGRLRFPFPATCIRKYATSPLKPGEVVEALGMAAEEDCEHAMFVTVRWRDMELAVPLASLEPITDDEGTRQAAADWRYWVDRGYGF